jgi:phosphoribosylanthranilate isomerase
VAHTRIKICGITRVEDALAAVASGTDALGLVFYAKSPRAVSIAEASFIVKAVPPFVTIVALFVDESAAEIERVLNAVPIDVIQFHGNETPQFCEQFNRPYVKALRVTPDLNLATASQGYSSSRGILLDTWKEGVPGGTGLSFDWRLAQKSLPLPMILAGGLKPENVGDAMAMLRPAAVDVSGGVESAPGIKDSGKIRKFIAAVRAADKQ